MRRELRRWGRVTSVIAAILSGGAAISACENVLGLDAVAVGCETGARRCEGNTAQACDAEHRWQEETACDPLGRTCNSATGQCEGVCAPEQKRCAGTTPEACDGGAWKSAPPCGAGTHCKAGLCVAECTPLDLRCHSDTPQECDSHGAWQEAGPVCPPCVDCDDDTGLCQSAPKAVCADPVALFAGDDRVCVIFPDGRLKCWGDSYLGGLGLGDDTDDRGDAPGEMGGMLPAVDLGSGVIQAAVDVGGAHTCALLGGGSIKCWGVNAYAQLGLGDKENRGDDPGEMGDMLPTVDLGKGAKAIAVDAGESHTCALLEGGGVKCWGGNASGDLGLGDKQFRGDDPGEMGDMLPLVDLGKDITATAISAGSAHSCALLSGGAVKCWGANDRGQLGVGAIDDRGDEPGEMGDMLPPVDLGKGVTAVAVVAGFFHTCALLDGGGVKCWGANEHGQLGLGDTQDRGDEPGEMGDMLPLVDLGKGVTATAIGVGYAHTCALLAGGRVKCWGANKYGELGLGDTQDRGDQPGEMGEMLPAIDLGPGGTATAIGVGAEHACALRSGGRVKCWGYNAYGQLGLGDNQSRGDQPGEMGDSLPPVDL